MQSNPRPERCGEIPEIQACAPTCNDRRDSGPQVHHGGSYGWCYRTERHRNAAVTVARILHRHKHALHIDKSQYFAEASDAIPAARRSAAEPPLSAQVFSHSVDRLPMTYVESCFGPQSMVCVEGLPEGNQ